MRDGGGDAWRVWGRVLGRAGVFYDTIHGFLRSASGTLVST